MGTTAQKLNKILETKEAIRTAINNKGGTLTTTDTFASYPSAIDSLPSGGGNTLKTLLDATKSTYYLFYNYNGTSVNDLISYSDTSSVTNMRCMFYECQKLTTIPALNSNAFTNCYHFTGQAHYIYNPQGLKDGRIYVPDDKVDALKTAKNWSTYADIIVPLSTLVE